MFFFPSSWWPGWLRTFADNPWTHCQTILNTSGNCLNESSVKLTNPPHHFFSLIFGVSKNSALCRIITFDSSVEANKWQKLQFCFLPLGRLQKDVNPHTVDSYLNISKFKGLKNIVTGWYTVKCGFCLCWYFPFQGFQSFKFSGEPIVRRLDFNHPGK